MSETERESSVEHGKRSREVLCSVDNTPSQAEKPPHKSPRSDSSSTSARRSLSLAVEGSNVQKSKWSENEVKMLVRFIMLKGCSDKWPAFRNTETQPFWSEASVFLNQNTQVVRTAEACRKKVVKDLSKKFRNPTDAFMLYFPPGSAADNILHPTAHTDSSFLIQDTIVRVNELLMPLDTNQQIEVLSVVFQAIGVNTYNVLIPLDFLILSLESMANLKKAGRSNVLYNLCKATGTKRCDGNDTLMPMKRLPMGLLEYCVNFFTASNVSQVQCPEDYRAWLTSMFCLFGTKWVKLFCGPMWSVQPTNQEAHTSSTPLASQHPLQARVNVPGLSERTLERYIVRSDLSTGAEVQLSMLDAAAKNNPGGQWWLKGDGCDIVAGVGESVRLEWSGDEDLDTGELTRAYSAYRSLLSFYDSIGLGEDGNKSFVGGDLQKCLCILKQEKLFLIEALSKANKDYEEKLEKEHQQKVMFEAGWRVEELSVLLERSQQLIVEIQTITDMLGCDRTVTQEFNLPRKLSKLSEQLVSFTKQLQRVKRTPATHIFLMMISCELRNSKPYAIPIQCVSYHSLNVSTLRRLITNILTLMKKRGMSVAGFTSNGEFNSMRNKGYTRPLTVFQIKSDVRNKYSRLKQRTMVGMLTPLFRYGDLIAKVENPFVSTVLLAEIVLWQCDGLSWSDIISKLRTRTVPDGYRVSKWKANLEEEKEVHKLRSILAQLEYTATVRKYDAEGVAFCTHLHVPEINAVTGELFCEREDPAHVFKRIANCTRNGGPKGLKLQHFLEALKDEKANLTYASLVGTRKQSVADAERLLSSSVADFMTRKGYDFEARYITAVNGWRRACDERGLSQIERSVLSNNFLDYILDDLMPWHKNQRDFSLLEVNKDISSVCGFTREVLVAVVADIETVEWRRRYLLQHGLPPEHPRASTTDDIECFFSVMRDMVGKNFTLKQVKYEWRKVCLEFQKRLDPDLGYYYFTSSHDRFHEGKRPSFEQPSVRSRTIRRVPRRESILFTSGRANLAVRGSLHVRAQFHNLPVEHPPPPSSLSHMCDHMYRSTL